jgi:hypothetical protein
MNCEQVLNHGKHVLLLSVVLYLPIASTSVAFAAGACTAAKHSRYIDNCLSRADAPTVATCRSFADTMCSSRERQAKQRSWEAMSETEKVQRGQDALECARIDRAFGCSCHCAGTCNHVH